MEIGTLEYDFQDFTQPRKGDEKLAIRFFAKARQDSDETLKQGRPIFVRQEYIQIIIPGDRSSTVVRPVTPQDKGRFEKQYEHWKKTQEEFLMAGVALESWGMMTLEQVEEYRYFGIRTVEQLADLNDAVCQKIMGATSLKQKAGAYLQVLKDEAPMKRVTAELEARDNKIAALEAAIADQAALLAQLQAGAGVKTATSAVKTK